MSNQLIPFYWEVIGSDHETSRLITKTIQRKWCATAKLTGATYLRNATNFTGNYFPPTIQGEVLVESELKPGELSAVMFQIGNYIVRSALRVYSKEPVLHYGQLRKRIFRIAEPNEMERIRRDLLTANLSMADTGDF